jgi:hypothetical protein
LGEGGVLIDEKTADKFPKIKFGETDDLLNLLCDSGDPNKRKFITDTSVLLITKLNPTCVYWRVRRLSTGYDWVCVEEE